MKIIDSHLHLPVRDELSTPDQQKNKLLSELKRNSVDIGIVIPDNIVDSPIRSLKQCISLFSKNPNIYILGTVNILENDLRGKLLELEHYFSSDQIKGLKIFPGHDDHYPDDSKLEKFFDLCQKYNKPLVIHTGENSGDSECAKYNDPKHIVEIAKNFKSLKIIISHLFWPKVEYCVELTKDYTNIHYDTSALADKEVVLKTGKGKIKNSLEKLITKYNKKVLYGSDYGMCSIPDHIELIKDLDISDSERADVFYNNAYDIFEL